MLSRLLEVDGVLAALLLSQDGLPVATANLDEDEAEMIGALMTATVASMRATTDRLASGDLLAARLATGHGLIDIYIVQELFLLILSESEVDRPTLDIVLADVTADCLELAL
jgi:predicted regulator of Ras-like GTPase activity (Roadblock/LC7/MglB family)